MRVEQSTPGRGIQQGRIHPRMLACCSRDSLFEPHRRSAPLVTAASAAFTEGRGGAGITWNAGGLRWVLEIDPIFMKVTIAGTIYDTAASQKLAHRAAVSLEEQLHQTPDGDFFLFILQIQVDGKPLGPFETWMDLRNTEQCSTRLSVSERIVALDSRMALEWSVKTQIPKPLRGYFLECM